MTHGYFIGLGDKTTCGGEVLDGDDRVNIFGLLHACAGDRVTCGKDGKTYRIVGSISHMESHGRLMAGTLDSLSDCPCRAQLIPSAYMATYQNQVRPTARTTTAVNQPSTPALTSHTATSGQASVTRTLLDKTPEQVTCNHPDMLEQVAIYIAEEMNRNITHPSVLKMKKLTSFDATAKNAVFQKLPWYARLSPPDFQAIERGNTAVAMALWAERVGQHRPWDHKLTIGQQFGGPWQKQGDVDYFYDIWSNIHYGYVGRVGGLSESALLDGAGLEQIASDAIRKAQKWDERKGPHRSANIEGMRAWDDIGDRVSISIGVNLHKKRPYGGITAKMLMDEVLALPRSSGGDGIREHVCK